MKLISVVVPVFNDTATTEIYTLSLHDALPILVVKNGTSTEPNEIAKIAAISSNPSNPSIA